MSLPGAHALTTLPPVPGAQGVQDRKAFSLRAERVADVEPDADSHACRAAHAAPPPGRHAMELRQPAHVRR